MRRQILLLLALFTLLGINARQRSLNEMQQAAAKALGNQSRIKKSMSTKPMGAIKMLKKMPSVSILGYDKGGFAIIANDDNYDAVLGYSNSNYSDQLPDGLQWWLKEMNETLSANKYPVRKTTVNTSLYKASVEPMIGTKWGQGSPYNDQCPNKYPTGCVATAVSQIMWYYKYPKQGSGSTMDFDQLIFVDYSKTTYDFANMLPVYTKDHYTPVQAKAVSTLMYHTGVACKMNYASGGSGTNYFDAAIALRDNFTYNKNLSVKLRQFYTDQEWMDMVYNELSNGRPILYGGADGQNGHAFVFEGYNTDGLVYVNWGWDGSSDGYYNMDLVNPSDTKYSFSEGQDMIIGFCKPDVSIPRSTTLGAEADLKLSVESGKIVFDFGEDFNVYNINDYTFDGTINLIAKDQRNQKTILWSTDEITFKSLSGGNYKQKFYIEVPTSLADGTYTLYLASIEKGYKESIPVTYGNDKIREYTLTKTGNKIELKSNSTTAIKNINANKSLSPYTYIYNMQGQEVYKSKTQDFCLDDVPAHGVLIVKQGDTTRKVVK